ncbi:FecR family protein [Sphingobacterium zeae]|uniref:Transmembrane sensor n=1 Tax=Sphingobacterium zeae TaxID=1776859 RepID=A0ABU0U435_9SPHI|nr:FecR domain-containing protein [Sphingobacterium zeae]MDQ1149730.1 transmembrane sensor [Sphingobacterium zeae]
MEKYTSYRTQDFLDDLDFVRFVKQPKRDDVFNWKAWRAGNPKNAASYDDALAYLHALYGITRIRPDQEFTDDLFEDIERGIAGKRKKRRNQIVRLWAAATGAAAVALFITLSWYYRSMVVVETGSGEFQTVLLPDSSTVQLNANSSIAYRRAWNWLSKREVFTTGEVLLEVKHLNKDTSAIREDERFTAYTGDVAVEVLGTKFNLKNRDNKITVSLLEGRIALRNSKHLGETKILAPGDIVEADIEGFRHLSAGKKAAQQAVGWTQKTLTGENLTVADLTNELRYVYGKEIIISDPALLNRKIDGRISLASQESIIYSIANILQANIRMEKDTIYLDPKEEKQK